MDHKIAGLLGAVGALASMGAAQAAAPTDILRAESYADLLQPIPNASAALEALDRTTPGGAEQPLQLAQFFIEREHHHHHNHYRRFRDEPRVVVVPRYRDGYRHHHHHHHHHNFYRRYRDDD